MPHISTSPWSHKLETRELTTGQRSTRITQCQAGPGTSQSQRQRQTISNRKQNIFHDINGRMPKNQSKHNLRHAFVHMCVSSLKYIFSYFCYVRQKVIITASSRDSWGSMVEWGMSSCCLLGCQNNRLTLILPLGSAAKLGKGLIEKLPKRVSQGNCKIYICFDIRTCYQVMQLFFKNSN